MREFFNKIGWIGVILSIAIVLFILFCIFGIIKGCDGKVGFSWSYETAIDEPITGYWEPTTIEDNGMSKIIYNAADGEYYYVLAGGSGVTVTPLGDVKIADDNIVTARAGDLEEN